MAIHLSGRIVKATAHGWASSCTPRPVLGWAGALDSSFDGDGRVVTDFLPGADNGQDAVHAVVVQADGRILAAGSGVAGAGSVDFAVARYRADGSLDPAFSIDGRVTTDFVGYLDEIRDLAVDSGGGIVAGGQTCASPGDADEVCDFGLARYTAGGRLDQRFGRQGRIRTDLGGGVGEGVRGVVVQRNGRIVAAGDTSGPGASDVGVARYRANGHLDRSFGMDGVVITPVSPSTDEVGGLALGRDGRAVVAGTTAIPQSFGLFVSSYRLA